MQTIMIVEDDPDTSVRGGLPHPRSRKRPPSPQFADTGSRSGHPRHHDSRHERPAGLRGDPEDFHRPHPLSHRKIAEVGLAEKSKSAAGEKVSKGCRRCCMSEDNI